MVTRDECGLGGLAPAVLDGMVDPLVVVRPVLRDGAVVDAVVLYANPVACTELGRSPDQLVGRPVLVSADLDPALLEHVQAVVDHDEPLVVENYVVTHPTVDHHLLVDIRGWRAGGAAVLTWRDVTEYADLLEAAKEAEHRSRLLAENASDVVFLRDAQGIIRWISASVQQLLGWSASELVGQDVVGFVHPDDLHLVAEVRAEVAEGRSPGAALARIRSADGRHRWMAVVSRPIVVDGVVEGAAVGMRDIDAQVVAQQEAEESERRYRLLAENSSDVILLSNEDTDLFWVSPSSRETLGWDPSELEGRRAVDFIHPDELDALRHRVSESTRTGATIRVRYRWRRPDGSYRWVEAIGRPIDDDGQGRPGRVVQLRDLEGQVRAEEALERRAHWDELTGLLTRGEVLRRLDARLSDRRQGTPTPAIAYCDLDGLKRTNDGFGHAAGDTLLAVSAERIRSCLRDSDLVGRMGGDEILVVLEGEVDLDEAEAVARKILEAVSAPVPDRGRTLSTTVSIGVALAHPGDDADRAVKRADRAMYAAKNAGRDQVVRWSPELDV